MIEKDDSIAKLIERLKSKIDFAAIEFVPYWDGDLCAIGLKRRNHLIYISTYNYIELSEFQCYFELELIDEKNGDETIETILVGREVSEAELVAVIKEYFQ